MSSELGWKIEAAHGGGAECAEGFASVAYLKFLHHKRRILSRNFKWKGGTRIMSLLVPMTFRSS
jgi:hypothetical protein